MKGAITIIVCSLTVLCFGQDLREEFAAMNNYLDELANYRMSVEYKTEGNEELSEEGIVSVVVDDKGLFYQLGSASIVLNTAQTILIDDEERSIIYSDNQQLKNAKSTLVNDHLLKGIDSLIAQADDIEFHTENDQRVYSIRMKNAYFDMVQVVFDKKTIAKVTYFYNSDFIDHSGVTATCSVTIDENIEFNREYLMTEYYLSERDGVKVPSEKFTNYLIIYNESLENFID